MKEIMPRVKADEFLAYQTLVSWNMLGVIAREIKSGAVYQNAEIQRLQEYLDSPTPALAQSGAAHSAPESKTADAVGATPETAIRAGDERTAEPEPGYYERMQQAVILNQKLAQKIRSEGLDNRDGVVWNLVKQSLVEKLAITNPRFGLD